MGWLDWLDKFWASPDCAKWIDKANKSNEEAQQYYESMLKAGEEKAALIKEKEAMAKRINQLFEGWKDNPEKEYWDNKYPKANISYNAQTFRTKDREIRLSIPVNLFITQHDYQIKQWVASKEAHLHNYPSVREGVLALYKEDRKDFKYQTDLETFGISEEWLFPFQTMKLIELGIPVDCEDRSHLLASRLITAGLPPFRVRTACGTIWTGKGHSTIQFLDDDLTTWRHLNSTSPLDWVNPRMGKTLNEVETMDEMPTTNDRKDVIGLGIKNYWFSFTNYASWNKFENKTSANTFKKEQKKGGLKYIEIKQ